METNRTRTRARVSPYGLVAWISFAKVGSTTLRYHLRARALARGWPTWPKPQNICVENFDHRVQPARLRCQALPDGYILSTPAYGYCELLRHRPCRYLTLLREPIARMMSAYEYYCRSCAEGTCKLPADHATDSIHGVAGNGSWPRRCPNLSLLEYVVTSLHGTGVWS